jgi:predicted dienelactone hydrolase
MLRRTLRFVAVIGGLGILGGAAFLFALWLEHRSPIELPAPTGRFPVGRTISTWVNDAQMDEFAPVPGIHRELLVWIWYPANVSDPAQRADYLPAFWRSAISHKSGRTSLPFILMADFFTRDPAVVRTHSSEDVPIASGQQSYPVVIVRAGSGALVADYTTLAEDLASHGYVVVGFDAPYRTGTVVFPDGRIFERPARYNPETLSNENVNRLAERLVTAWSADTRFVVDRLVRVNDSDPAGRFTGRLDLTRLGIFGHSLGGATSLQFCHDDARCRAAINIDGNPFGSVVEEGAHQPCLLLFENVDISSTPKDPEVREMFDKIRSLYNHLGNGGMLTVRNANHFSFGDVILLKSHYIVGVIQFLTGGLEVRRGLAITTSVVHTFFDIHLKSSSASALEDLRESYPEIQPFRLRD